MPSFHEDHKDLLRHCLADIDVFAQQNVLSGRGGPFSARLALFTLSNDGTCKPHIQFPVSCNMVIETGIASCHAEAQALNAGHIAILKQKIRHLSFDPTARPIVVLFSSAQPCMACQSKIEICAQHLAKNNYIVPKDFYLVYGASYAQTEQIAGFHDYAYALDFFSFGAEAPSKERLISYDISSPQSVPDDVRDILNYNALIDSVVVQNGHITGLGYDQRTDTELFRTSECVALNASSKHQKSLSHETPWLLPNATLYTLTPHIGPLSYAECQWSGVDHVISVTSKKPSDVPAQSSSPAQEDSSTAGDKLQDCPTCTNEAFFKNLSEGYNSPWSALTVVRDGSFSNTGQNEWATKQSPTIYNGHKIKAPATDEQRADFDRRFCPLFLE